MPNHVTNYVEIKGEEKHVAELVEKTLKTSEAGVEFDFNGIIPMPEDIYRGDLGQAEREKYGDKNWYDWAVENWGTKWNAYDASVLKQESGRLVVQFDTAWSPPEPIFDKLVEMGFEVNCMWQDEDESNFGHYGEPWDVFERRIEYDFIG